MEELSAAPDGARVPLEYRFRHKDGHWVWLFGHDVPFQRNPDGSLRSFIGSFVDVSAQRRVQEDLERFAHMAAHDLREPARRLQLYADLLLDEFADGLPDEGLELLRTVDAEAGRMLRLVGDIRSLTKLKAGALARERVRASEIVDVVLHDLAEHLTERDATVEVGALPEVNASPSLLHAVYANLAENALRYGGDGVELRFTVEPAPAGPVLGVWNSGSEIPEAKRALVLRPFGRLGERSGTGLGLSICRRIVEQHEGRLWIESEPGWTHVRFTLGGG